MQLLQAHPEFRFMMEDDVFVANFMESHRGTPEADAFKALVKSGRLEIAPKWIGTYQNLPRAEALARNLIYGKRYAREVFGVDPQTAHHGDIPGFTEQYPQLLRQADVPNMVMTRMGPPKTPLFTWKAPDGSTALVWDTVRGYGWGAGLGLSRELDDKRFARIRKEIDEVQSLNPKSPIYLGWGSDLLAPNENLANNVSVLNQKLAPTRFQYGTPTEFFKSAAATPDIPVLSGEIPSSWTNLISSLLRYWTPGLVASDTLVNAEKFAAINDALGYAPYPQQEFDRLWKMSLETYDHNNFGQGEEQADEERLGYVNTAISQGGQIMRESLRNIAERVARPSEKSTVLVVFNPLSWNRTDVVRAHVSLFGDVAPGDIPDYRKGFKLVDSKGNSVPFDLEKWTQTISRAITIVFTATDVPSLGYKTYYLEPADSLDTTTDAVATMDNDLDVKNPNRIPGADVFENRFYRVTIDRPTGRMEIFDKDLDRVVTKDAEMSAVEERGGNSLAIEPRTGRILYFVAHSVALVRNGAAETVVDIEGRIADVPITQRVTIYNQQKRIDLDNTVHWTPGSYMKIEQVVPLDMPGAEIRNGVPYGSAAEADTMPGSGPHSGDEVKPEIWKNWRQIQDWIAASTPEWNLTVSADHQMFAVDENAIRGDMMRGIHFNSRGTTIDDISGIHPVAVEQPPAGDYVFHYSITSGKGNWAAQRSWQNGLGFNNPLIAVESADEINPKTLPAEQSFLNLKGDNLVVTALKKSDIGNGMVLRFYDVTGKGGSTPVNFLGQNRTVQTTNLLEESDKSPASETITVKPYQIDTIAIPAIAPATNAPVKNVHAPAKK